MQRTLFLNNCQTRTSLTDPLLTLLDKEVVLKEKDNKRLGWDTYKALKKNQASPSPQRFVQTLYKKSSVINKFQSKAISYLWISLFPALVQPEGTLTLTVSLWIQTSLAHM